jgi:hypothetical protein
MNRNWRDLTGGIFLVFGLHIGFWVLSLGLGWLAGLINVRIGAVFSLISLAAFLFPGVVQFTYLIPVWINFQRRHRFEVAKGISIGAVLTIFLNGACFGWLSLSGGLSTMIVIAITLSLMAITFDGFNRR